MGVIFLNDVEILNIIWDVEFFIVKFYIYMYFVEF